MSTPAALAGLVSCLHRETWSRAGSGRYEGVRDGRIIGALQRVDGGFVALDAEGTPVGIYDTKAEAARAVRTVVSPAGHAARRARDVVGRTTATVAGGVALAGVLTAAASAPWF